MERLRKRKVVIDETLSENKRQLPKLRQQLQDLEMASKALASRVTFAAADGKISAEKLAEKTQQAGLKENMLRELRREVATLGKDIVKKNKRMSQLKSQVGEVETAKFRDFSRRVGIDNIRAYEDTKLKRQVELRGKLSAMCEQRALLTAQLEYEQKRDFSVMLTRTVAQLRECAAEIDDLRTQEDKLMEKEGELRASCKEGQEKVKVLSESRRVEEAQVKQAVAARTALGAARDVLVKRLTSEEMLTERARAQLHDVLQRAEVDEISLPVTVAAATGAGAGAGAGSGRKGKGSSRQQQQEGAEEEGDMDRVGTGSDLRWGGSISLPASSSLPDSHDSTTPAFSQSGSRAVVRDARTVSRVDLSSVRDLKRSPAQALEREAVLKSEVAGLATELDKMQPNMHAVERYEGVSTKLKGCVDDLDQVRDEAREVASRFEEVKKERQQLFQACFDHISATLQVIYKDLTRSSKHPLGESCRQAGMQ